MTVSQATRYEDAPTDPTPPVDLKRKTFSAELKIVDEEQGIVEALVSVTNNLDSDGEKFRPGSWTKHLKTRRPKGVRFHDWSRPVAKTLEAEELMPGDERLPTKMKRKGWGALRVRGQYNLSTQAGRDAFADVKFFGDDAEWSVGFRPHKTSRATDEEKEKEPDFYAWIDEAELYEWSDVLFGANPETTTLGAKSARAQVVGWLTDMAKAGGVQDPDTEVVDRRADDLMKRLAEAMRLTDEPQPTQETAEKVVGVLLSLAPKAPVPDPVDPGPVVLGCMSCGDSTLVLLDGDPHCGGCVTQMREHADAVVGAEKVDARGLLSAFAGS